VSRCALCPGKFNMVGPDGPQEAEYVFIGEAPGRDEDRHGRPFVGKTGREVNEHYLPLAGLRREQVYFSNSIRCYPDRPQGRVDVNRNLDRELLNVCSSHHLFREMELLKPRLIIPMGVLACHVIGPDIDLELQHGIPLDTAWGKVFPMYHPAGGLHEPKKMLLIRNDWVRLGKYIKHRLHIPHDTCIPPDYREIGADALLEDYLECNHYSLPMACDTESKRNGDPYCLTFSIAPGTGNLIRADGSECLEIFQAILDSWKGPILWHNWMYDQRVVAKMGLRFPEQNIVDTMVRAYHLGNVPQGLKALAYRLLGMKMKDFDDVVTPYSTPKCLSYIRGAMDYDWPKPEEQTVRDENGQWKLYKPQSMGTKFKRFLTDYSKNPEKDIYKSWDNWSDDHELIESRLGPWPGKCISYVPFNETLHYACRDADALLRVWPILEGMTRQVRRKLSEHWEDA
jgi:uracil-DNA glycosylase